MLYLGIDQHRKQITVNLRNEEGGFVAILEVCGFNDWLLEMLDEYDCQQTVLVQSEKRSKKKTDRRDASALSEVLWVNRLRHNLHQECPTKGLQTKAARKWLAQLSLDMVDRQEMKHLLAQWDLWDEQRAEVEEMIKVRQQQNDTAMLIATVPGGGAFSSLTLASRIGDIKRFATPASLANYWGLVPGCRNSGEATDRLGSITKEGSAIARFILGQMVLHVLRKDPAMRAWYARIKKRRGAKIARVAVMRRLATIIWRMVRDQQPYVTGGRPSVQKMQACFKAVET